MTLPIHTLGDLVDCLHPPALTTWLTGGVGPWCRSQQPAATAYGFALVMAVFVTPDSDDCATQWGCPPPRTASRGVMQYDILATASEGDIVRMYETRLNVAV